MRIKRTIDITRQRYYSYYLFFVNVYTGGFGSNIPFTLSLQRKMIHTKGTETFPSAFSHDERNAGKHHFRNY